MSLLRRGGRRSHQPGRREQQVSDVSEEESWAALLKPWAEPGAITLLLTITSISQQLPSEETWQLHNAAFISRFHSN